MIFHRHIGYNLKRDKVCIRFYNKSNYYFPLSFMIKTNTLYWFSNHITINLFSYYASFLPSHIDPNQKCRVSNYLSSTTRLVINIGCSSLFVMTHSINKRQECPWTDMKKSHIFVICNLTKHAHNRSTCSLKFFPHLREKHFV